MNATIALVSQHRALEALFEQLDGQTSPEARVCTMSELAEDLIAHLAAEEAVFHPAARRALGEEIGGHFMLCAQLRRVLATSTHDAAFQPRFEALRLLFAHAVESEETDLFPRVEAVLGREALEALGTVILASRPPVWVVTTEAHALLRSVGPPSPQSVSLPPAC
jgi:hemerythrin superfamily protein